MNTWEREIEKINRHHSPVDTVDRSALVIPSQQEKVFRVLDLVRQQQADRFKRLRSRRDRVNHWSDVRKRRREGAVQHRANTHTLARTHALSIGTCIWEADVTNCDAAYLLPTVDVVAEEEVVGLWWEPPVLKQPQEVIVLPVNITCAP